MQQTCSFASFFRNSKNRLQFCGILTFFLSRRYRAIGGCGKRLWKRGGIPGQGKTSALLCVEFLENAWETVSENHANGDARGEPLPVSKGGAFAQSPDALRQVVLGYNLPHFNNCYADSSAFGGSFFPKMQKCHAPGLRETINQHKRTERTKQ